MPNSKCENCKTAFAYDLNLGLNVKYFECEANAQGFRAGGDFPCCPNCESRCEKESAEFFSIKVKTEIRFNPKYTKNPLLK